MANMQFTAAYPAPAFDSGLLRLNLLVQFLNDRSLPISIRFPLQPVVNSSQRYVSLDEARLLSGQFLQTFSGVSPTCPVAKSRAAS